MASLLVIAPSTSSSQPPASSDHSITAAASPTPSSISSVPSLPSSSSHSPACHSAPSDLSPSSVPPITLPVDLPVATNTPIVPINSQPLAARTTTFVPHHMVTRRTAKSQLPQAHIATKYPLPPSTLPSEPTCFTQANKDPQWRKAMQEEYNALL